MMEEYHAPPYLSELYIIGKNVGAEILASQ